MYFFRLGSLKRQLNQRPATDREALPYLLVYAGLGVLATAPVPGSNAFDYAGVFGSTAIVVLGSLYAYRRNGGASGSQFLHRFFMVGWVVALRWALIGIAVAIPLYAGLDAAGINIEPTSWWDLLLWWTVETVIFLRLGHHLADLSRMPPEANADATEAS
ncbi:MAG: hypothetical protein AAGE65_07625 [Planctomycetota bacterium]